MTSQTIEFILNEVIKSRILFNNFKKSGDMFRHLERFNEGHGTGNNDLYNEFKIFGLNTFEDAYPTVAKKFKYQIEDVTVLDDFVIGREYTGYDIAIFSRTYNVQSGIYLIGDEQNYQAIFIKVTLKNGKYPNEWIIPGEELKYYMYAPKQNYDPNYKYNRAIINSKDIPIYVFIKNEQEYKLEGIFKYIEHIVEADDSKWFRLRKIDIKNIDQPITQDQYEKELDKSIKNSTKLSHIERKDRLKDAPKKLEKINTTVTNYKRNPYVIAEVLKRANGNCEKCTKPALFIRKSDNTPYLEVHHKIPLSENGDDTVENAMAVCPNCHRELYFGV